VKILSQSEQQIKLDIKEVKTATSFTIEYGEQSLTITVKPFK